MLLLFTYICTFTVGVFYVCSVFGDDIRYTECRRLNSLVHGKQDISCDSNKQIFISKQNFVCDSEEIDNTSESACLKQNSSSLCFESIPSDISKNYVDFFVISKKCNGLRSCTLEYVDFTSVANVVSDSSQCSACRIHKYETRNILYYECIQNKTTINMNTPVNSHIEKNLYLQVHGASTSSCRVVGTIKSARILEQSDSDITITSNDTIICKGSFMQYNYNENIDCLEGLQDIFINVTTKTDSRFWMELFGCSFNVECGGIFQDNVERFKDNINCLDDHYSVYSTTQQQTNHQSKQHQATTDLYTYRPLSSAMNSTSWPQSRNVIKILPFEKKDTMIKVVLGTFGAAIFLALTLIGMIVIIRMKRKQSYRNRRGRVRSILCNNGQDEVTILITNSTSEAEMNRSSVTTGGLFVIHTDCENSDKNGGLAREL